MTENGTATFTNPADYQTGIGDANVSLVLTARGDFKARLTWLKLRHLPARARKRGTHRVRVAASGTGLRFASHEVRCTADMERDGAQARRRHFSLHW